ncbi:MAG: DNA methyltransferase, partial [Thermotogota bacterium]
MEKKQAQEYIKQVLNSRFDQEQFELFVRNLLNEFETKEFNYSGNLIPEAFRDHISYFKRLGVYTDPEGERMDLLIVQTKSVSKLERTRTALRNFVVRHLKNREKFYALVAFYSKEDDGMEWRLSLVKIDIETERTEKGKIKAKEEIVPAKRFSFLVGENENAHTAQKQLLPLLLNDHSNPLIIKEKDGDGSVEGAFSIEKVTDEFYEQYKELYLKLTENTALTETLEKEGLDPVRFVKKLLGQIVFLYFLQKKGWLGVPKDQKMGAGPKNFLRKKFDEINENGGSYFNDFLRFLFYDALAKEHNDEGIKYFNKNLGCKIPFLNGGLFEADYENWDTLDLNIDNLLFSNPNEKTKAGDRGTGILDVFDRYNFTIREDEPLEKEVAVDPEMLGKVFENLLDVTDRKSKGAFYTPREIVHYMCQESLIHYLDNTVNHYTESYQSIDSDQTNLFGGSSDKKGNLKIEIENKGDIRVPKEDIERFIRHGHLVLEHETTVTGKGKETDSYKYKLPESIRNNAEALDKALADIKICDPAIGSGAFPVGLLHEIVIARLVLNSFLQKDEYTAYNLKRHAIQESIYGVDIDPSAIDIARLRLWLSMIVDEEDYETIDALPNLDYKIVCGNSLIGFPKDWQSPAFDKIESLKNDFFNETDLARKKELKERID